MSPDLHPYANVLSPYVQPSLPPPPPPLPSSSIRCFLLSSSLPPLPHHVAFIPYTPYTPSLAPPSGPNVERSRALCWRRRELTKEDWAKERKGLERWLRWVEGKEVVLVSGSEAVQTVLFDREDDIPVEPKGKGKTKPTLWADQLERFQRKGSKPVLSEWVQGQENFIHPFPLQPPLLAVLNASSKVSSTMSTMVSRYVDSFTDGTQSGAFNLIWERSPLAFEFLVEKVPEAWKNLPDNLRSILDPDGGTNGRGD